MGMTDWLVGWSPGYQDCCGDAEKAFSGAQCWRPCLRLIAARSRWAWFTLVWEARGGGLEPAWPHARGGWASVRGGQRFRATAPKLIPLGSARVCQSRGGGLLLDTQGGFPQNLLGDGEEDSFDRMVDGALEHTWPLPEGVAETSRRAKCRLA
jgi:hypothetical protein